MGTYALGANIPITKYEYILGANIHITKYEYILGANIHITKYEYILHMHLVPSCQHIYHKIKVHLGRQLTNH